MPFPEAGDSMRTIRLGLILMVLVPALAGAQTNWTVTVTPTVNPLPVGTCGPVWVKVVDPKTRDTPRNPSGGLVTIADFDLTVSAPDGKSVAGQYTDASHWSVCACQGGPVGTVGTITASYPGKLLDARTRVAGLAFETTATLLLAGAKSGWNPPSCTTAAPAAIAAPIPLTSTPPSGTRAPVPVTPPPSGPAPSNILVLGNPAETMITWSRPSGYPGPVSQVVERWKTSDPACCRATSPTLSTETAWFDPLMWPGTWTYQVTAIYADGRRGSASVTYTYPEPEVPKGFTAEQVAKDTVVLTWQRVRGASYYMVGGPPDNVAIRVDTTTTRLTRVGVRPGPATWQVAAMYQGRTAGSPQAGSALATASLDVVNPRYRLVAEAIRVTHETVDKPLSEDGMYDEVYVASYAELLTRGGSGIMYLPLQLSAVHGDISNFLPLDRTQAGTASVSGGIRANDIVSPVMATRTMSSTPGAQFVLWEGELYPGKQDLVLHPMIWEVDQFPAEKARDLTGALCPGYLCVWYRFMMGGGTGSVARPEPTAAIAGAQIAIVDGAIVWIGNPDIPHLERHDRDRPIGLEVRSAAPDPMGLVGMWRDKMVILSSEKIEAALAANQNRIEVRFWDHWVLPNTPPSTVNYLNGDYTLVIRIERMP